MIITLQVDTVLGVACVISSVIGVPANLLSVFYFIGNKVNPQVNFNVKIIVTRKVDLKLNLSVSM